LIWAWRHGNIGSFATPERRRLQQSIRDGWPHDRIFSRLIDAILRLPRPLAKAAFALSFTYCKAWMAYLRVRNFFRRQNP